MIRLMNMNVVFLGVTVAVAFANYHVKYTAQREAQSLAKIERQISRTDEQIRVLDAEWSHLNEPLRLQTLAERHLALKHIAAAQVVLPSDLPARFQTVEARGERPVASNAPVVPAAALLTDDR